MGKYLKNIIDGSLFELTKILMVFSITITITGLMWYEISYVKLFAIIVVTYTVLLIITYNMKFFLVSIVSMTSLSIIDYVILVVSGNLLSVVSKINRYIDIYNDAIVNGALLKIQEQLFPILIITFLTCLTVILISKCKYYFIGLSMMGLAIFLIASFVRGYYNVIGFYIFVVAIITNYFYYFYNKNIKNKNKHGFYLLAVNSIIFSLILVFLAGSLYRLKPRPLLFMYDIGKSVEEYINSIREKNVGQEGSDESGGDGDSYVDDEDESDEDAVPYETTDLLKPKVETTSKTLLCVYTDHPIYLRGSVCNIFDGKQWDYYVNYNFKINDNDEHLFGLKWLTKKYITDNSVYREYRDVTDSFFKEEKVGIIYKNIATNILFTPTNYISIYDSDGNNSNAVFKYDASEVVRYNKILEKDFTCSINYLKPKYNLEMFQNMMKRSKKDIYKSFSGSSYKEDLIYKSKKIRQEYMQMPDSITDRTKKLADDITKDYHNDYDKAKAIEIYLKSNIDYSFITELPDNGEDIIDNFLFETKEGFCTYSATAMIMMLRSVEIPARYVKGFVIKEQDKEDIDNIMTRNNKELEELQDNKRIVTGYDAHAWVEAYLEGYGWLPFEPTSGFNFAQETIRTDYFKPPQTDSEDIQINDPTNNIKEKKIPTSYIIIFLITLMSVISVLLIISRLKKLKQYYETSTTSNKIIKLFTKILMLMEIAGYKKYPNQTIREYAKGINGQLDLDRYNLMQLTKIYEIACYSKEVIENDKLELFEGYYEVVKKIAKKNSNVIVVGLKLFFYNMK